MNQFQNLSSVSRPYQMKEEKDQLHVLKSEGINYLFHFQPFAENPNFLRSCRALTIDYY